MDKVRSADGTAIAYERSGAGRLVVLVAGALCDRSATRPLAEALEATFTVVSYDRRGRGDSGDAELYEVAREVEDLAAVIEALGGEAAVYGHSSGAGLAVQAVAAGLPITTVVLHEPPYSADDAKAQAEAEDAGAQVVALLTENRRTDAVELFLTMAGMPADAAAQLAAAPGMAELAPTLAYEFAVMDAAGPNGTVPLEVLGRITQPTLAVCGSASPPFMVDAARLVAKTVPGCQYVELPGQDHVVPPELLAPVLKKFLT